MTTSKPTGYTIWEGASPFGGAPIVAILTTRTTNRKTGDMAQLWILHRDMSPIAALQSGADAAICGACPLRGTNGRQRACYVVVPQAPQSVWSTYRRGGYPHAAPDSATIAAVLRGRRVRLGAYGDPAMLPYTVVRSVVDAATGHTGYTHQWPVLPREWAGILMASADSIADRRAARAAGWRSFYVVPADTDTAAITGAMECAATRTRNPLQCAECLACAGTRDGAAARAVDVYITAHGSGAKYVSA